MDLGLSPFMIPLPKCHIGGSPPDIGFQQRFTHSTLARCLQQCPGPVVLTPRYRKSGLAQEEIDLLDGCAAIDLGLVEEGLGAEGLARCDRSVPGGTKCGSHTRLVVQLSVQGSGASEVLCRCGGLDLS